MASINDYLHKYSSTWSTTGTQWIDTGYRVNSSDTDGYGNQYWTRSPYNSDWYRLETAWDKLINEICESSGLLKRCETKESQLPNNEPKLPNVEDLL